MEGDAARDEAVAMLAETPSESEEKLAEARESYQSASEIDSKRQISDIEPRLLEVSRLERVADALVKGDALLAEKDWKLATEAFKLAAQSCQGVSEANMIQARIDASEYGKFLNLGIQEFRLGIYAGAGAMFERAQKVQNTEEVREWLAKVAEAIGEEEE